MCAHSNAAQHRGVTPRYHRDFKEERRLWRWSVYPLSPGQAGLRRILDVLSLAYK